MMITEDLYCFFCVIFCFCLIYIFFDQLFCWSEVGLCWFCHWAIRVLMPAPDWLTHHSRWSMFGLRADLCVTDGSKWRSRRVTLVGRWTRTPTAVGGRRTHRKNMPPSPYCTVIKANVLLLFCYGFLRARQPTSPVEAPASTRSLRIGLSLSLSLSLALSLSRSLALSLSLW